MGFEDEVEQSNGRPCCQRDGRSKRPRAWGFCFGNRGGGGLGTNNQNLGFK
jgi:hypothetical protein